MSGGIFSVCCSLENSEYTLIYYNPFIVLLYIINKYCFNIKIFIQNVTVVGLILIVNYMILLYKAA